jgi:opacity protein-like surface antigen
MTNKTTKICCTLALLVSVATTPAFSQSKNFAGPSIAIGGGYNSAKVKSTETVIENVSEREDIAVGDTTNFSFGDNNFNGLIDLSYGIPIDNNFVLSIGATYDLTDTEVDAFNSTTTVGEGETTTIKAKFKDHHSVYIQPTYLINNSTGIFAKFGYHKAKGNLSLNNSTLDPISLSKNFDGWGYGIGAKTFINNNIYLQFEGSLVEYRSKGGNITNSDEDVFNESIKPEILSALISVGYKF